MAQSFIAGMQAKRQKEAQDQAMEFQQQQAALAAQREERLAKAQEAETAMQAYGMLGKGITEGYTTPERADIAYRQIAPQLYPETITQKPVSEILPTQELPTVRPPMQEPRTAEQTQALQQLQVINDRLGSIDQLPVPEQIKTNLRDYLTSEREKARTLALGEPSAVQELPTAPRGGGFVGARPQQIRGAGAIEQKQAAPALFGAPGGGKAALPFVKETFQTITKLLENENISKEEGSKFMASLSGFMKSGDVSDLYIPKEIGENASKKERLFLENLRLQQQIKASKTSEEFMRARMAQLQGETPGAKLEDIQAKARAATLGREQAKAEVSLKTVGNIAGDLNNILGLFNKIPSEYRGPGFGGTAMAPIGKFLKTEPNLVAFEDTKRFFLAGISRNLGEERGVLTDADVKRVESLLPNARDTDESAQVKTEQIYNLVDSRVRSKQQIARLPVTGLAGLDEQAYNQLIAKTQKKAPKGKESPVALPPPAIAPGTQPKPSDPATTKYLQDNFPHLYQGTSSPSFQTPPGASTVPVPSAAPAEEPLIPEEVGGTSEDLSGMSDDELLRIMMTPEVE
jgi:hypothetical protein